MKQQIQVNITPVDNGFQIRCVDPNTKPQTNLTLVATSLDETKRLVTDFIQNLSDAKAE